MLRVIAGIGLCAELVLVDTYLAEIFPTAIRTTGSGVCYSLSRAPSTVMPFVAVPALAALGPVQQR